MAITALAMEIRMRLVIPGTTTMPKTALVTKPTSRPNTLRLKDSTQFLQCGSTDSGATKASIIYKATGNLRAIQILLDHTKIENTVRYLGVDVEDALELAEATEV